jgi:hypothetical protein
MVSPIGNSTAASGQITVHTLKLNSGVDEHKENTIIWSAISDGVSVRDLPAGCQVLVLDMMGRQVQSFQHASCEIKINLNQKGIYLLQVKQNQEFQTYKIRF